MKNSTKTTVQYWGDSTETYTVYYFAHSIRFTVYLN